METRSRRCLLSVVTAICVGGCFGPPAVKYDMLPVEGTVTLDGKPLVNAEVMLDSMNGPRGFGVTDENGRFTVTTRQFGSGLPAGSYRVFIAGSEKTRLGSSNAVITVAARYRETGVGKVTIGPGSGPLAFDLKQRPDARHAEAGDASER